MSIFQSMYDNIKKWTTPDWLKILVKEIWEIIWAIILSVGKEYIRQLEAKIIEVAQDNSLSNQQKFDKVFSYAKSIGIALSDSSLRLLIETLVSLLKKQTAI